ncbi:MAG TPA: hypothetical protein VF532_23475 [Candidatus Angelobacter sp.]
MQTPLPSRKARPGCLVQLILLAVLVVVVMGGVAAITSPWAFFMGGGFHLLPTWEGWGRMHSNLAGGDYAVYVYFYPKVGRFMGLRHVAGDGLLCTPRGEKFYFTLGGDFDKNMGRDSNGKSASFYLNSRTAMQRFMGQSSQIRLVLRGQWNNPDLVLDDDGSIARYFEPDGSMYTGNRAGRPYMREVVPVTLHPGSKGDFEAACQAVKSSH